MCRSPKYACLLLSIFAFGFVSLPASSSLENASQSKLFKALIIGEGRQNQQTSGKIPLILLPGIAGSRMENDPNLDGKFGEVWPNGDRLVLDPWDRTLLALKLAPNGRDSFGPEAQYATVQVGDIVRSEYGLDFYGSAIAFFTTHTGYTEGKDFFVCPYDWRKDLQEIAYGALPKTLDGCIREALSKNPGVTKVDLLAHSMGGLVARAYIADSAHAQKIRRLITLGAPFLGAPEIVLAVVDKLCFAKWMVLCFSNPDVLHEMVQNFPAGYQIAPGSAYWQVYPLGYYRRDRDADGDELRDGYLTPEAVYRMLGPHNSELAQKARALYGQLGGWSNGGANGVEVFDIVGDQHATIGTIVEYEKRLWYNPWGPASIAYRTEVANGDGTVPLHSADMRNPANGTDLSGEAKIIYFDLEHKELDRNAAVLQLAANIYASPSPVDVSTLLQQTGGNITSGLEQSSSEVTPRSEPLPLNGRWIMVDGPVRVQIEDSLGNQAGRTGPFGSEEENIPDVSYTELDTSAFVFLPEHDVYTVRLSGREDGSVQVRIQILSDDQVIRTDVYADLPVTGKSLAVLVVDPAAASAVDFKLDQDGSGVFESNFPPTAILNAEESRDNTPPQTAITLQGDLDAQMNYTAPVTVTLSAQDNPGGSGVAKIEYSLDSGQTSRQYSRPFQLDPRQVQMILAKSVDRAGNEESPLASARLALAKIFLPALSRP